MLLANLKMVNFFMQHFWMLHDVVVVWSGSCNNVAPAVQLATRCNRVAKCLQHVAPNNVAICCVEISVTIVWRELANAGPTSLGYVAFRCCYGSARALNLLKSVSREPPQVISRRTFNLEGMIFMIMTRL